MKQSFITLFLTVLVVVLAACDSVPEVASTDGSLVQTSEAETVTAESTALQTETVLTEAQEVTQLHSDTTATGDNTVAATRGTGSTTTTKGQQSTRKSSTKTSTAKAATNESPQQKRDRETKAAVNQFVRDYIQPGMSEHDKAETIFLYLCNNVAFQDEQSNAAYQTNFGNTAYGALVLKKAACSGFCRAVTQLCDAVGLKSRHINAGEWTHQWNKVSINGEWIVLDAQGGIFGAMAYYDGQWLPIQGHDDPHRHPME